MPAEFDKCVRALIKDPNFKPKNAKQTKKDAAFAVCTAQYKKRHGKNPMAESYLETATSIQIIDDLNKLTSEDALLWFAVLMLERDKELWQT